MAWARNGDVELYYETFGEPSDPALLLVNGLGSQCINYRVEWCEKFAAEGFFVIRFDNRDVGLSTKFADFKPDVIGVARAVAEGREPNVPYTLSDMAADAIAVLDERRHRARARDGAFDGRHDRADACDRTSRSVALDDVGHVAHRRPRCRSRVAGGASAVDGRPRRATAPVRSRGSSRRSACGEARRASTRNGSPRGRARCFDRCFDPAGQARQTMAISASPSRTAALGDVRVPTLVHARLRRHAHRRERRSPHGRGDPRRAVRPRRGSRPRLPARVLGSVGRTRHDARTRGDAGLSPPTCRARPRLVPVRRTAAARST